jgi:DNA polymerase-1
LFQHTGAIVMDVANAFMDAWLGGIQYEGNIPCYKYKGVTVKRVIFYHDENQWECPPEVADEIGQMGVRSIVKAGEFLGFNVPLDADYDIGKSWAETH